MYKYKYNVVCAVGSMHSARVQMSAAWLDIKMILTKSRFVTVSLLATTYCQ